MELELVAFHDVPECSPKHFTIEKEGAMLKIIEIIVQSAEHLLKRVRIAIVEGSIRGDTGTNLIEVFVARIGLHNLIDEELPFGPRAYESHITDKYVPQLRKLVKMVGSEEFAGLREAFVAVLIEQLGHAGSLGIGCHRAELINLEWLAVMSDSLLSEDGGASILLLDHDVADQKKGGENNQTD